ncbi:MAG: hypothetical protein H7X86_06335 [Gorillibacterium sp.]|nr:hypothetical protein [Gorillibacterium sp.]
MMDHNHLLSPEELRALLLEDEEGRPSNEALNTLLQKAENDLTNDVMELKEVVRLLQTRVDFLENLLQGHLKADPIVTSYAIAVKEDKSKLTADGSEKNEISTDVLPTAGLALPPRSERHTRAVK